MKVTPGLRLRSIQLLEPTTDLPRGLESFGFKEVNRFTIVCDGKFWERIVYHRGVETVSITEEKGEVVYMRDPVVTICGGAATIKAIEALLAPK